MEYKQFEGTVIIREHAGPLAMGGLATSAVGLAVLLAFGHHADPGPVRPASAVTTVQTTTTNAPAPTAAGCVMFCDEPPLPPQQDSRGCRLFCELGMAPGRGDRS